MFVSILFCCQAEDGIRYLVRSRGLGDVYKRQILAPNMRARGLNQPAGQSDLGFYAPEGAQGALEILSLIHI